MASPDLLASARPEQTPTAPDGGPRDRRSSGLGRVLPELAGLLVVVVLWPTTLGLESSAGGPGPAFFPRALLGLLAACSVAGLALEALRARSGRATPETTASRDDDAGPTDLRRALVAAALVLGYVAGTALLGFVIASTLFVAGFLWLAGQRRWWTLLGVSVIAPLVLAYVFVKVVYIALPTGLGPFDTVTVALYAVFGIY